MKLTQSNTDSNGKMKPTADNLYFLLVLEYHVEDSPFTINFVCFPIEILLQWNKLVNQEYFWTAGAHYIVSSSNINTSKAIASVPHILQRKHMNWSAVHVHYGVEV